MTASTESSPAGPEHIVQHARDGHVACALGRWGQFSNSAGDIVDMADFAADLPGVPRARDFEVPCGVLPGLSLPAPTTCPFSSKLVLDHLPSLQL